MHKKQSKIQLYGVTQKGAFATKEDVNVKTYVGTNGAVANYFQIQIFDEKKARLVTPKGAYKLHTDSIGILRGLANKCAVRIKIQKNVGELSFWA